MKLSSSLAGLAVLASGTAFGQPVPGSYEGPSNTTQSVLPNLLPTSQGGTIDARLDFTLADDGGNNLTLFTVNAHGQFLSPGGLGGYVSIPFVYASGDDASGQRQTENGVGNLEVGGLYAIRQSIETDILLRGGIAIDTSSQEDLGILAAGMISPKIIDIYASGFDTTWGRAQAQFRHATGNLRLGGEVGFDLPIDGLAKDASMFDGALNAALSIGVQQPSASFGLGFALVKVLTDADVGDTTFTCINATVDFAVGGTTRFFGTVGYPEPDENEFDIFSVGGGLRAGF